MALTCCCCGAEAPGKQWWNRDKGFGLCPKCAAWMKTQHTPEEMRSNYGVAGVNYKEA